MRILLLAITFLVGLVLWITPPPEGVTQQAWQVFSIFVATIFGIVSKPMPMGAIAFAGLCALVMTKTLTFAVAFSGFSNDVVWLIVFAFFVARGFIKTGLGARISYLFVMLLGRKTLGLGYGIMATELVLAPAIPSSTARSGGVVLPIVESLATTFGSHPHDPSSQRMGSFLTKVAAQSSCITSAMFLTSMSANPMIARIAESFGFEITWGSWILASCVPGIVSLIVIPYFLYRLYPPLIKESPDAPNYARGCLAEMGRMKKGEWIMLGTFLLLIVMWIFGKDLGINAAVTALFGLVILLLFDVLTWDDIRKESGAWETLVWFAILLMMAAQLSELGFMDWFSSVLVTQVQGFDWHVGLLILSLIYFYAHYFFASNLAHVGAMYASFLGVAVGLGAPLGLSAFLLGFFSNLFGALTQYSCGPAALLFGTGYVRIANWWKVGFLVSLLNIAIWVIIGGAWWKFLGLW